MATGFDSPARAASRWRPRALAASLRRGDAVAHIVTLMVAALIVLITSLLVYHLWTGSALSRSRFGLGFLFSSDWDPYALHLGALTFVYGTVVTSAIALALAVPLGLGAAIFLAEMAPAGLSDALAFLVDLLAAVPSVIYGLLGIFVLIPLVRTEIGPLLEHSLGFLPLFRGPVYGMGLLTAGLVLAVMVVPFIISVSREVLRSVPREQREAALALGATRWEMVWQVVVPYARTGIWGSIFLALARALGETMAVAMVIGSVPQISSSLLGPGNSIAAVIANEFTEATDPVYLSALIELGLVLFLLTFILNGVARLLILATTRASGSGAS